MRGTGTNDDDRGTGWEEVGCWAMGAAARRDWEGLFAWRYGHEEVGRGFVGEEAGWRECSSTHVACSGERIKR